MMAHCFIKNIFEYIKYINVPEITIIDSMISLFVISLFIAGKTSNINTDDIIIDPTEGDINALAINFIFTDATLLTTKNDTGMTIMFAMV